MRPNAFHWWIYRVFRYFWNPILHSNPMMRRVIGVSLVTYESEQDSRIREDDEKIVDALLKRRLVNKEIITRTRVVARTPEPGRDSPNSPGSPCAHVNMVCIDGVDQCYDCGVYPSET